MRSAAQRACDTPFERAQRYVRLVDKVDAATENTKTARAELRQSCEEAKSLVDMALSLLMDC